MFPETTVGMDDIALQIAVIESQIGDRDAFARLVRQYDPPLRYFATGMLQDSAGAEEVVQDTWLAVLRQLPRLSGPEKFVSWLYAICRNQIALRLRRSRTPINAACALSDLDGELPAADDDPEFGPDEAARIHAALAMLSPEHREVLILRFMEDLTYEQVAAVVGTGVGTVRSRLFYAKQTLRRHLQGTVDDR